MALIESDKIKLNILKLLYEKEMTLGWLRTNTGTGFRTIKDNCEFLEKICFDTMEKKVIGDKGGEMTFIKLTEKGKEYQELDCPLHNLFFRFFYMSCIPPSPILISCGLRECFVPLIFITDNFLLSMVGSSFRRMIPSARNSEMPSLERSEEPNGSSDVITEVHFAVSKTFIM